MHLTQRLDLHLLAPTVLVSLILVAVCIFGALYLNSLNVNITAALTENVQSTEAAAQLETPTRELLRLLRSDQREAAGFVDQVEAQNGNAARLLKDAQKLANLEEEKKLVGQITDGLRSYLTAWNRRAVVAPNERAAYDRRLADELERQVLVPCTDVRRFNADQVQLTLARDQEIVRTFTWGMLAVAVGGPLCGLLLGFIVARSLRRSIYQLSVHIRDAAGRLSRELGSVTLKEDSDLPGLQHQMRHIIDEIGRVVDQLEQREREVLRGAVGGGGPGSSRRGP